MRQGQSGWYRDDRWNGHDRRGAGQIEFLTITGSGNGVDIVNRADVRLTCNDISNNQASGVFVIRSSNAVLRDNTLSFNGQRSFGNPFIFFDCGLFAVGASSVRSEGNTYEDNQYCAIEIDRQSSFRNGAFLPREAGNPADPNERDVFTELGCDPGTGDGCFTGDQGPVVFEVFNGGNVEIRNADVNGEIEVTALSSFRVDGDAVIQGNIANRFGSVVRFRDRRFLGDRSVSYTGTLSCTDTAQTFFSDLQCGQTCSGAIPGSCTSTTIDGTFETGLIGWAASGINGGSASVVREGTCFSSNNTLGLTLNGDFAANVRSSSPAPTDSIGILTSDLFMAGSRISFRALSENHDGTPAADPVTLEVSVLDGAGSVLLSQIVKTNIVTLDDVSRPGGEARDGIFSTHIIDTSALAGQVVRLEFRQHTNVSGQGFFTLIDDVDLDSP